MFQKLLIANRGEIACRIIRTARRMGIRTVAVYSEADTNSLHVAMADEAYHIGPSASSESYLSVPRLVDAIVKSGAEAVHPGFGFLSENPGFAEAVTDAGAVFVGPPASAMRAMGDKIEAKKLAEKSGVRTIPGYTGAVPDAQAASKIAADIGYPVMVKAAAGGGGKGMRIVRDPADLERAYVSASNEARNSFADGRIFIEKYIDRPRHIEIQVLADGFGNIVCLGERECSVQRHNQKVIEEAPSSFITPDVRAEMYRQSASLAQGVGYVSAGTVEYVADAEAKFYFLEMNTRLQVEHPVTEYITGLDLVEQMLRVAAGERLAFSQSDIVLNGHAFESRIYAEDPSRGFLPSCGRISEYREPEQDKSVRVDSGAYEGGEVSMFYDPMIAKLITYGATRAEAAARMQLALGAYVIRGIAHNIPFLEALFANEKFLKGDIHTKFIEETYPEGFSGAALTDAVVRVFLAAAVHCFLQDAHRAAAISGQTPGRRRHIGNMWVVNVAGERFPVYARARDKGYDIKHGKELISVRSAWSLGGTLFQGVVDGRSVNVHIRFIAGGFVLTHAGVTAKVTVRTPRVAELERHMPEVTEVEDTREVRAPISGMVVQVRVKAGDVVEKGAELLVLEAMKMENLICAERGGTIKSVSAEAGCPVAVGDVLMEYV